jgi:TrmH family RNA methyltransferase
MDALPDVPKLDDLVVVMVRARNPLNIGAAARAMSNFGARRLRLVNPYEHGFREARSAVGAADLLAKAEVFETVAEAVADCSVVVGTTAVRHRALPHPPRILNDEAGNEIRQWLSKGRVAILFGSEKFGLSNQDFDHCHWLLRIPTEEVNISMNLGQAVAVCLYEFARAAPEAVVASVTEDEIGRATAGERENVIQFLLEALDKSFYIKPGTEAVMEKKVRGLIMGFELDTIEAKILLGMLRQIVWKLRDATKNESLKK